MPTLPIISSPPTVPQAEPTPRGEVPSGGKGSYCFISLGCPKNTVDSERMLGRLQLDGYKLVDGPATADFAIVNTCGFIEAARQESFGAIDEMLASPGEFRR